MDYKYGINDVILMDQNLTKRNSLSLQKDKRKLQEKETEYLNSEIDKYSQKNIDKVKNDGVLANLTTFGSIVKINAFKSIIDTLSMSKEEKIVIFDNMLSDLNNSKSDNFIYLRVENTKGFLFYEIFPRLKNKSVKIKF